MASPNNNSNSVGYKSVEGVLKKYTKNRNEHLLKNIGKYSQYKGLLSPAIGEAFENEYRPLKSIMGKKNILQYTHDGKSQYSKDINNQYGIDSDNAAILSVDLVSDRTNKFDLQYDYLHYIEDTFHKPSVVFNLLAATQPIMYESGVIRDINVSAAIDGVITTNPNDMYLGTPNGDVELYDTNLGRISNTLYSNHLFNGAMYNEQRNRVKGRNRYITPYLYYEYGNNPTNVFRLSDILRIDQSIGRVRTDLGKDVHIKTIDQVDEYNDGQMEYLFNQFEEHKGFYTPFDGYVVNNGISFADQVNSFEVSADDNVSDITTKKRAYYNFNEHDIPVNEDVMNGFDNFIDEDFGIFSNEFDNIYHFVDTTTENDSKGLLQKTNKMFNSHKIQTLAARFHTSAESGRNTSNINSAVDRKFGNSKGRNLLKLDAHTKEYKTNGYSNPYCRVWTYHHQYDRHTRNIRPFAFMNEDGVYQATSINEIQGFNKKYRSSDTGNGDKGGTYLAKNTVLLNNGLVRITPTIEDNSVSMKKYMFSIENLAWKGFTKHLSKEQIGPNGGRIMWFPPYDLEFNESITANWNDVPFIGRGEKIHTYTDTDRSGSLSFTLLIDHPSIINSLRGFTGMGEEKDVDADILRFFAGCMPMNPEEGKKDADKEKTPEPKRPEPKVKNPEEGFKVTFPVFFPNNYSGNSFERKKEFIDENGYSDVDWWTYLLIGENCKSDNTTYNGYEVKVNSTRGISASGAGTHVSDIGEGEEEGKDFIYACKTKQNADFKPCDINSTTNIFRYRPDFDLRQHALTRNASFDNYTDSKSYGLNCNLNELKKHEFFSDCNYTFAEVFAAMQQSKGSINPNIVSFLVENGARDSSILVLKDYFDTYDIKEIRTEGYATSQDSVNAPELAKRRQNTVKRYIKNIVRQDTEINIQKDPIVTPLDYKQEDNDKIDAKIQRCAKITIIFNTSNVEYNGNDVNDGDLELQKSNEMDIVMNEDYIKKTTDDRGSDYYGRYDNEYQFFNTLELTAPHIYKSLKDKYKYFDPSFHSMSPEGFNSRLNFLHQCTRQGHTVSASEYGDYGQTAGNLAFGTMPVCVLRIGDFYNTRIIIRNIGLTYSNNGVQWDLNPEGAGVQPMYCKVTMAVVFVGGNSLTGPVNRLQNAQTFDFYANTGVYDNRADIAEPTDNGNRITYQNLFTLADKK